MDANPDMPYTPSEIRRKFEEHIALIEKLPVAGTGGADQVDQLRQSAYWLRDASLAFVGQGQEVGAGGGPTTVLEARKT